MHRQDPLEKRVPLEIPVISCGLRLSFLTGQTAALLLGIILVNSAANADDWPQWLGPNRNGISTEKSPAEILSVPRERWKASVGIGVCSIVVSKGRAFTIGHVKGPERRGTDTVYCLNADTGQVSWKYPYDCLSCQSQDVRFYGPRSTPTVDGDPARSSRRIRFFPPIADLQQVKAAIAAHKNRSGWD